MHNARMGKRATGQVRIIGGKWRNTRLPVPDAHGLRPTSDRTRETLFNWLQPVLPGARVLDLFAGSGALGFEAVSRGAHSAVLVERDAGQCEILRGISNRLPGGDAATVVQADALAFLRSSPPARFDLAFVDPPFDADLWDPAVAQLDGWLQDTAWLYVEWPLQRNISPGRGWRLHREGAGGDARHALYRRGD